MAYSILDSALLDGHFCFVEDEDSGFEVAILLVAAAGIVWLDSVLLVDSVGVLVAVVLDACCPGH